jgi:hypothetical protein
MAARWPCGRRASGHRIASPSYCRRPGERAPEQHGDHVNSAWQRQATRKLGSPDSAAARGQVRAERGSDPSHRNSGLESKPSMLLSAGNITTPKKNISHAFTGSKGGLRQRGKRRQEVQRRCQQGGACPGCNHGWPGHDSYHPMPAFPGGGLARGASAPAQRRALHTRMPLELRAPKANFGGGGGGLPAKRPYMVRQSRWPHRRHCQGPQVWGGRREVRDAAKRLQTHTRAHPLSEVRTTRVVLRSPVDSRLSRIAPMLQSTSASVFPNTCGARQWRRRRAER